MNPLHVVEINASTVSIWGLKLFVVIYFVYTTVAVCETVTSLPHHKIHYVIRER